MPVEIDALKPTSILIAVSQSVNFTIGTFSTNTYTQRVRKVLYTSTHYEANTARKTKSDESFLSDIYMLHFTLAVRTRVICQ